MIEDTEYAVAKYLVTKPWARFVVAQIGGAWKIYENVGPADRPMLIDWPGLWAEKDSAVAEIRGTRGLGYAKVIILRNREAE